VNRPRLVAVISAIAASTVAFLIVSRWRLAGTITGAALIPVVYTFVSHWSTQSLDKAAAWLRRGVLRGRSAHESFPRAAGSAGPEAQQGAGRPAGMETASEDRMVPAARAKWTQWLVIGFASAAVAVSVYALTAHTQAERVIVHERVVEKTVTVTSLVPVPASQEYAGGRSAAAVLAVADDGTASTTAASAQGEETSSTTVEAVTTTTSPPDTSTTTMTPTTAPPTTAPPTTASSTTTPTTAPPAP